MPTDLETYASYEQRKLREVQLLSAMLGDKQANTLAELPVLERKTRLARLIRASVMVNADWAGESRNDSEREVTLGTYHLKWRYQRYDLEVSGPWAYDSRVVAESDALQLTCHANCGMAAIGAVLQSLNSLYTEGLEVRHASDAYYETQRYLQALCPNLSARAIRPASTDEGSPPVPSSRMAIPACLLIDSIGFRAHDWLLDGPHLDGLELILIDTTCYAGRDARLTELIRRSLATRRPVVLLRSHIKLDWLGLEYARLGSATFLCSSSTPDERLQRFHELVKRTRIALSTGGSAHATQLFPASGDLRFEKSNTDRLERLIAANQFFAAELGRAELPQVLEVKAYHHGLFTTVRLASVSTLAQARHLTQELAEAFRSLGIPAEARGSFGLDVVALDTYLDLTDQDQAKAPTLRVALADLPRPFAERCVEGFAQWAQL